MPARSNECHRETPGESLVYDGAKDQMRVFTLAVQRLHDLVDFAHGQIRAALPG